MFSPLLLNLVLIAFWPLMVLVASCGTIFHDWIGSLWGPKQSRWSGFVSLAYCTGSSLVLVQWVQLHPQIFRKTDFAPTDFEEIWFMILNFCIKVPFIFRFLSKYKNLHPQFWNPNKGPDLCIVCLYLALTQYHNLIYSCLWVHIK